MRPFSSWWQCACDPCETWGRTAQRHPVHVPLDAVRDFLFDSGGAYRASIVPASAGRAGSASICPTRDAGVQHHGLTHLHFRRRSRSRQLDVLRAFEHVHHGCCCSQPETNATAHRTGTTKSAVRSSCMVRSMPVRSVMRDRRRKVPARYAAKGRSQLAVADHDAVAVRTVVVRAVAVAAPIAERSVVVPARVALCAPRARLRQVDQRRSAFESGVAIGDRASSDRDAPARRAAEARTAPRAAACVHSHRHWCRRSTHSP